MTTLTNGQVRKSLAEQIDRLDRMLDGLADGLNDAVASAVKNAVSLAVQEAVQAVLAEVLTNPDLHKQLRAAAGSDPTTTPAPHREGWGRRLGASLKLMVAAAVAVTRRTGARLTGGLGRLGTAIRNCVMGGWHKACAVAGLLRLTRKSLLVGLGIGAAVGLGCFFAGPVVASVFSGLAGFAGSLVTGTLNALHKLLVPDELPLV